MPIVIASVKEFGFCDVLLKISDVDTSGMEKVLLMIHRVTLSVLKRCRFLLTSFQ